MSIKFVSLHSFIRESVKRNKESFKHLFGEDTKWVIDREFVNKTHKALESLLIDIMKRAREKCMEEQKKNKTLTLSVRDLSLIWMVIQEKRTK